MTRRSADPPTTRLERGTVRALAAWDPGGAPVTSLYLNVDGRRFPRKADYLVRLEELVRAARHQAEELDRDARRSVEADLEAMSSYVRERFERDGVRGLALFSSREAGLWEAIALPRPVRNRAVVGPEPDVLPLEELLETYPEICTVLVDSEKARIFLAELGRIEEGSDVWDEVPGRHDQGGWAQMRYQRHVDDHRQRHLKHVAEVVFRRFQERPFDHLVLAGPQEVVAELERELHDYVAKRVRARIHLPITATPEQVLERSLALEEEITRERERARVARLAEAAAADRGAVVGPEATFGAIAAGRVGELLVDVDLSLPGTTCRGCGRPSLEPGACPTCGGEMRPVPDVVEAAVALAVRQGARVETVNADAELADLGGIGAFLRF